MSLFSKILNNIPRPVLISFSRVAMPLLDLYYRGNTYTDPINKKSYRKFLPYGYSELRSNVLSPGTLSLERHRLMWLYLKRETDLLKKKIKVLHFAPEQAFYKRFKNISNWEYITVDLYSPIADVKADITELPFKDNEFDFIICNHVLEHIHDDISAMKELYRVMKPGGKGIFQIPLDINRQVTFEDDSITDKKERAKIFGQYDHVRIYGMDYFDKLNKTGFKVYPVEYAKKFTKEEVDKYRLNKSEILPIVEK